MFSDDRKPLLNSTFVGYCCRLKMIRVTFALVAAEAASEEVQTLCRQSLANRTPAPQKLQDRSWTESKCEWPRFLP